MNITLLTHWATVSSFYEYALAFSEELHRLGHKISILAPPVAQPIPTHSDGKRVLRVTPDVKLQDMLDQLATWETDVLLVQGECMSDHNLLGQLVHQFTQGTKRSFLLIHTDDFSKTLNHAVFTAIVLPNSQWTTRQPPGRIRLAYMEQGIPVFSIPEDLETKRDELRRALSLPVEQPQEEADTMGYYLVTFDGKTNVPSVLQTLRYINQYKLVGKPVHLFVQVADASRLAHYAELTGTTPFLHASVGRVEAHELAPIVQLSDGVLLAYPETPHQQTSSAMRFALGCQVPILTNRGRHTNGLQDVVTTWLPNTTPEGIKHAIVSHFTNPSFRRLTGKRHAEFISPKLNWPVVVKQFQDEVLQRSALKHVSLA